jgi:FxLD family lantipeptide
MIPATSLLATDSAAPDSATSISSFLDGLDMRIVETGPAVHARKCSTDNGCDTQKTGDC